MSNNNPVILGIKGLELLDAEKQFFKSVKPEGFILFARNIDNPEQVKNLVESLRDLVGFYCPILIDQEGGRVARLRPPHWPKYPAIGDLADIAKTDINEAKRAIYKNSKALAGDLISLGINVDCAPVLDLRFDWAHNIVGDRSFGLDPDLVAQLAKEQIRAFKDVDVIPVIKHIPGHGRAKLDSHEDLPVVDAPLEELRNNDFKPFIAHNNEPYAMTAHIVYTAIDPENPATLSKKAIELIRSEIGFTGQIMTDDLSMKALKGSFAERSQKSLDAGCDLLLHCNGDMDEMQQIASIF